MLRKKFPGTMVVLTYHSVKPEQRYKFETQMDELLKIAHPAPIDFDISTHHDEHFVAVSFDDGFQSVLYNALPALHVRKIPAALFITTGYLGKKPAWISNPSNPNADEIILTEEQLEKLPDQLITIGSHTATHPHLIAIGEETLLRELTESKKRLEELLHEQVTLISLPYGAFDIKYTELFRKAGYRRVFLNIPTFPATKTSEYITGRIDVSLDDWLLEFRLKLLGAYQWLPLAIAIKNKLINFYVSVSRTGFDKLH